MSREHRRTAADWHEGRRTRLWTYALTGAVTPGIELEIFQSLDRVEHRQLGAGLDPVDEHERLRALLHHVEPEIAAQRAVLVGGGHGRGAAARWQRDALRDQAPGDRAATARQVLQGIEDGDPALFELVSGWDEVATRAEIAGRSGWPEPHVDDRAAHDRWEAAQPRICDAYVGSFVIGFWTAVAEHCLAEIASRDLVAGVEEPGRPAQRDGRDRAAAARHALDRVDPSHGPAGAATAPTPPPGRGLSL